MREIKFRAWNKEKKEMQNVDFVDFRYNKIGLDKDDFLKDFSDGELMQYTGLKDKNGVEIYGGDIVEFTYNGLFLKGEVVFSNSGWELKGVDYGEHFRLIEIVHLCEVTGNIYENKELLK